MAQVAVDVPLAHLDRPFDYAVPDDLADGVRVGCRVRVRFAGQLVDGVVLGLTDRTAHEGRLAPLAKVVSAEPVLTDDVAVLARSVADRWAGTLPDDVLEKAIGTVFDLRPGAIVRDLDLLRPIYKPTAAYGHFGRTDVDFPWERLDRVDALRSAVGMSAAAPR